MVTAFSSWCSSKINVPLQEAKKEKNKLKKKLTAWVCRLKQYHFLPGDDNPLRSQPLRSVKIMLMISVAVGSFPWQAWQMKQGFSTLPLCWISHVCTSARVRGGPLVDKSTYIRAVKHWLHQPAGKWFWECGHWAWPMEKSTNKGDQLQGWTSITYLRNELLCLSSCR